MAVSAPAGSIETRASWLVATAAVVIRTPPGRGGSARAPVRLYGFAPIRRNRRGGAEIPSDRS